MGTDKQLERLVAEDKAIEAEQDNAILRLMEHRWTVVNEEKDPATGKPYAMRAYARALGHRSASTVRKYVRGWELWRADSLKESTPLDVLVLANLGEDQRQAVEVVTEVYDVAPSGVQQGRAGGYQLREEAKRVRADIDEGAERLVEEGLDPVEARDKAAQVVKDRLAKQRREAELQADRREREKQSKTRAFRHLEYELSAMRKRGANALQLARESNLEGEDELIEFLEDAIAKVRHTLELISLAIVGETQIDWDAELTKLNDEDR